jgi:uncharacterized protein YbcV (DUF1398 family)
MRDCSDKSAAENMPFPEVVRRLTECGVESYRTDLYRSTRTFYMPNGESQEVEMEIPPVAIADGFSDQGVIDALQDIQQKKIGYVEFLQRIGAAGTTNYFVYLTGRCALYLGREGGQHLERFPAMP